MYYYTVGSNAFGICTLMFTYVFFHFKKKDADEITSILDDAKTGENRETNKQILEQ